MERIDELSRQISILRNQNTALLNKYFDRTLEHYNKMFPTEDTRHHRRLVEDMRKSAFDAYKEYLYPQSFVNDIDKSRANWNSLSGLTIHHNGTGDIPIILISTTNYIDSTYYHELTHVSDFSSAMEKHGYQGRGS